LLSIIVPIYNAERFLYDCLYSLVNQDMSLDEYEIILINDGSTDCSNEIIDKFLTKYPNIHVENQNNQGQSVARNKGLDFAKGRYVIFVDSDDMLFPNVLSQIISIAEENMLDVCAFRIKYTDEFGNEHLGAIQPFETSQVFDGRYAIKNGADIGAVWLNLYSREMIEKYHLRFYPGIFHQDVDFNLRMYAYANRIMFTDIIGYYYRFVSGSSTRKPNKQRKIKLISDDMTIVRHIRDFSNHDKCGYLLKDFYTKHGNSMVISCLYQIIFDKDIDYYNKIKLLDIAKNLNIYPIKGSTLSWKNFFLKPFFNNEWVIRRTINFFVHF